jgi:hypothetical protein
MEKRILEKRKDSLTNKCAVYGIRDPESRKRSITDPDPETKNTGSRIRILKTERISCILFRQR